MGPDNKQCLETSNPHLISHTCNAINAALITELAWCSVVIFKEAHTNIKAW